MKNFILIALSLALVFAACSKHDSNKNPVSSLDKISQEVELDKRTGEGDGKGEGKDDKGDYTKNIIKPIVKLEDCDFPVEGTIEYVKDGKVVATIDYGNGECDNIATKTVDGKTYEFEMDNRKGDKKDSFEGYFKKMGVSEETVDRIRGALEERGFTDEQIEVALKGMIKIIYEMKKEGENFELDPEIQNYFVENGLSEEQIDMVLGLSHRLVGGMRDSDRQRSDSDRNVERKRDDGINWEEAKSTPPEEWSDELKAQIEAAGYDLEEIAERVSKYQQEEATRTERKIDLDAVKQELDAAVEAGRITREQADARLEALMERIGK